MTATHLDKDVTKTTAAADTWRENIKTIEKHIASTNHRLEKAEAHRKKFALDASLGDVKATAEIAAARSDRGTAEGDLHDLTHALSEAKAKLQEAEHAAKTARKHLARANAEIVMRERVNAAAEIDVAIAAFAAAYAKYEQLGKEILSMPDVDLSVHGGMTGYEYASGTRRIASALPTFFAKFFPGALHDETPKQPLEFTEARFWNLLPAGATESNHVVKAA